MTVARSAARSRSRSRASSPIRCARCAIGSGLVVDHLERHVATVDRPDAVLRGDRSRSLRQDLAAAYLEVTQLARRLDELDRALHEDAPQLVRRRRRGRPRPAARGPSPRRRHRAAVRPRQPATGARRRRAAVAGRRADRRRLCRVGARGRRQLALRAGVARRRLRGRHDRRQRRRQRGRRARSARSRAGCSPPWGGTVEATSAAGQGCAFELRLATA